MRRRHTPWSPAAPAMPSVEDRAAQIDVLLSLALEQTSRDPQTARAEAIAARTMAIALGDREREAQAVVIEAAAAVETGEDPGALLGPALEAFATLVGGPPLALGRAHLVVATLQYYLGLLAQAADHAAAAVRLGRAADDPALVANATMRLGTVLVSAAPDVAAEADELSALFQEAIDAFTRLGRRAEQATALYNLGVLHLLAGRFADVIAPMAQTAEVMRAVQPAGVARAELLRALALARLDRVDEADAVLGATAVPADAAPGERVLADLVTGITQRQRGDLTGAAHRLRSAEQRAQEAQDLEMRALCLAELAEVEEEAGNLAAALGAVRAHHETWVALRSEEAARRLHGLQVAMQVEAAEHRSARAVEDRRRLSDDVERARAQLAEAERRLALETARRFVAEQSALGHDAVEQRAGLPMLDRAFPSGAPGGPLGVIACRLETDDADADDETGIQELAARVTTLAIPGRRRAVVLGRDLVGLVVVDDDRTDFDRVATALVTLVADGLERPGATRRAVRIGTAHAHAERGDPLEDLVASARLALDSARRRQESIATFTPAVEREHQLRRFVAQRFHAALDDGSITLHFQPIVTTEQHRIVGAEALVRWFDPARGQLPTQLWVSLLEEIGWTVELGRHVLLQACHAAAGWPHAPGVGAPYVSVNASPLQLPDGILLAQVDEALASSGLDPHRLVIELTESRHVDLERGRPTLERLRDRGVTVRIDDFGVGYSNFGYLTTLPVDGIKLDRAFLVDGHAASGAVIGAITGLARSLGLVVIAEGVETDAHRQVLRSVGVEYYQGWLFDRDLPVEAFARRLASQCELLRAAA